MKEFYCDVTLSNPEKGVRLWALGLAMLFGAKSAKFVRVFFEDQPAASVSIYNYCVTLIFTGLAGIVRREPGYRPKLCTLHRFEVPMSDNDAGVVHRIESIATSD